MCLWCDANAIDSVLNDSVASSAFTVTSHGPFGRFKANLGLKPSTEPRNIPHHPPVHLSTDTRATCQEPLNASGSAWSGEREKLGLKGVARKRHRSREATRYNNQVSVCLPQQRAPNWIRRWSRVAVERLTQLDAGGTSSGFRQTRGIVGSAVHHAATGRLVREVRGQMKHPRPVYVSHLFAVEAKPDAAARSNWHLKQLSFLSSPCDELSGSFTRCNSKSSQQVPLL